MDARDIADDGLRKAPAAAPPQWNRYVETPDPTRWSETERAEDRIFEHAALQAALATAYADKVAGRVKGDCSIGPIAGLKVPNDCVVQIPFRSDGCLKVVALRPGTKRVIPNDAAHAVQRRAHRLTGQDLPEAGARALLGGGPAVPLKGGFEVTAQPAKRGYKVVLSDGRGKEEQLYP